MILTKTYLREQCVSGRGKQGNWDHATSSVQHMLLMLDSEMIPTLHFRQEYWPSLLQDAPVEVNKNNHAAKVYGSSPQFEQEAGTLAQGTMADVGLLGGGI